MSEENKQMGKPNIVSAPQGLSPWFWLAALLPLVGYLGAIGQAEAKRWGAPSIKIAIEGYDPRDPVRGHYLRYRVRGDAPINQFVDGGACAGVPVDGVSPVYFYGPDKKRGNCEHELPLDFVREDHRYYIQQDKARELEDAVREGRATLEIKVVNAQTVTVERLFVDGRPVGAAKRE